MINIDKKTLFAMVILAAVLAIMLLGGHNALPFLIPVVFAHCDTMDGPLILEAKQALEKGDVTPVLKWVKQENEAVVKQAFKEALVERKKSPAEKEKADMRFFETLVRIHREGEGAEFTGLKPASSELEPAVKEADLAIENGSAESLVKLVSDDVTVGIHKRFEGVLEKRKHKDESVEAGREFVAAYVEFVHYVEHLDKIAKKEISSNHEETHEAKGHHED